MSPWASCGPCSSHVILPLTLWQASDKHPHACLALACHLAAFNVSLVGQIESFIQEPINGAIIAPSGKPNKAVLWIKTHLSR